MVPLTYLSNFFTGREMPWINCEINLILIWSENSVITPNAPANQATTFGITDTNIYVMVVTLLTQDNTKLLQQLKSGIKRTIKWNKYQWKLTIQAPNPY